jgi:hypothetical protein
MKEVVVQGKYMGPGCHAMDHDMTRMGTQISNSAIMALYTNQELKRGELILVNEFTGMTLEVTFPPPKWSQLCERLELGLHYDKHTYFPYQKKVEALGKCPKCGKSDLGYIGLKRIAYHWRNIPAEIHLGLCPECDSCFFVDVKK